MTGSVDSEVEYLNSDEAAAIIRMSPEYVRRQCKAGRIPATKLGKEWRITPQAIQQFMAPGQSVQSPRQRLTARDRKSVV